MELVESMRIRGHAATYAKQFLADKYREEYLELYTAYCKNRGLSTRRKPNKPLIDERLVVLDENQVSRAIQLGINTVVHSIS